MSLNKVLLIGRLGKDPETKEFGESKVTNFSVATSEKYKKDGELIENTTWHQISAWGKVGEICSLYLKKGKQVYIEGKIQTRKYEKDGETKYATNIIANNVQFLGSRDDQAKDASVNQGESQELPNMVPPSIDNGEEIPF